MSTRSPQEPRFEPIAVVGMACRLPGGASPAQFWEFLARGGDAVTETPPGRWDVEAYYDPNPDAVGKMYTNRGAYIEDVDRFSPTFFGISPREAQYMDPQQRLLLELHWEALENAAIAPQRLAQQQVGIFAGMGTTDYGDLQAALGPNTCDTYSGTGGAHSAAAGRISYVLGVRGPSLAVDSACSSSLVSVHLAMVSLRSGESDLALASGVCLNISPDVFVSLCKARMLSPDGCCKVFDASANGYVRGEGAGVLVLKRLSDALADGDRIEAVLRGSAMNHNGRSAGLTVPSGPAQQEVIHTALRNAGLSPSDVAYLEAHGTGTAVGDPIEAGALGAVFAARRDPLLIGSVKTNCGHLEWAAGVAGLIKTILSIQKGVIPPSLHLRNPNPLIAWDRLPLRVVTEATPWPEGPRIAGVSSFGFGGTNAHVLVEEAPQPAARHPAADRPAHLLTLSARSEPALRKLAEQFAGAVSQMPPEDLASICYTANTGRARFEHRLAVITDNNQELAAELGGFATQVGSPRVRTGRAPAAPPAVCMLFTGQGSQFPGMGKELYATEPVFRREIERCGEVLDGLLARRLHELLFAPGDEIHQTRYTQPGLFALEYALARLWQSWGVEPDAVLGHSVGEYVAACVAGVLAPEDALKLIEARGRLMWALPSDGAMFAIRAAEDRVLPLLAEMEQRLSIAAVNSPNETVISGARDAAESVAARLRGDGVVARELSVSHAFHSPLMEPMLDEFARVAATITFRPPTLRLISNLTGREAGDEILDPKYWVQHIRGAVRFADSIRTAAEMGCGMFLEAGPQPVLCGLGRQTLSAHDLAWLPSLHAKRRDWSQLLDSAGEMFVRGLDLDWEALDAEHRAAGQRRKTSLPTYPFERERYWFPPVAGGARVGLGALRPLVESVARSPLVKEKILSVTLGAGTHPYLADHRVLGQVVVPGAAYLALLASGAELLGWSGCAMEKIFFLSPLVLPEHEGRTVQAVLTPADGDGDTLTVELAALSVEDPALEAARLMSGRIAPLADVDLSAADIDAVRQRCREEVETDRLYDAIREAGIELRDSFRWIRKVWLGKGEALAELRLPEAAGSLDGYRMHPALLDAGFQVASAILDKDRQSETLLPFSVARMRQRGEATGTTWWCHAVMTGHSSWDIRYYDANGAGLAEIDGFEMREAPAATFLRRRVADWLHRVDWQVQPVKEAAAVEPGTWLVLDDGSDAGLALQTRLAGQGGRYVVVSSATPGRVADLLKDSVAPRGIVHMWAIAAGAGDPAARAQALATGLLEVVHAALAMVAPPPIWVATCGAQAVGRGETVAPEQAVLWGMARGLLVEAPDLRIVCVDLDSDAEKAAAALAAELDAAPGESQTAWRGDDRHVARLVRCPDVAPASIEGPFRLQLKDYGSPDNLQLVPMKRKKPVRDQVEIAIAATALNFRDVLISLGMLRRHYEGVMGVMRASDIALGFDCAGTISAVGEGVTDLAVGDPVMSSCTGSAASHATTYRQGVIRMPEGMDMATAAALPTVFWTAYHGLVQLAQLARGERILIHAAAGGVGLAAIQLAQHVGAEVFATASPAKWDYLRSLGVEHIMNSRTLDFADEVMRLTGGEGVDVVLNSLAGAVVERTFSVLKRGGRFIEIGRLAEGVPDEAAARPDAAYLCFDVGAVITRDYAASVRTGNEIRALFERGVLRPLPITEFGIDAAAEAYRFMQQSRHIGKIVLRMGEASLVRPDASYLITGGLGGIGLRVAGMLAQEGARHLILAGRSEPTAEANETIVSLREQGAAVTVVRGDVSQPDDVARMIAACQAAAPLRGIFHSAGVLRDALIRNQTAAHFAASMAAKVRGAWELHTQTSGLPLDHFVCFSSMASMVGSAGQNNYCAANAFLDGLAALRRSEGLPALSIAWGPWAESGMAAALELGGGVDKISVQEGLDALRTLMQARRVPAGSVGVMKMRWDVFAERLSGAEAQAWVSAVADRSRRGGKASDAGFLASFHAAPDADRQKLLEQHILDTLRKAMGLGASHEIARAEGWSALGVDSLMMVEIISRLESSLRLKLPVELMAREASIRSVSEFAFARLKETAPPAPATAAEPESSRAADASLPGEDALAVRTGFRESMRAIPQVLTTATDQKRRQVLIEGRWRCDFASCNYLGFDLEPEVGAAITGAVERWGTHPSWTRAVSSPALYGELEQALAQMLGVPDTLVFPSISLLHLGVLPTLAGYHGIILTDAAAHHSIAEACMRAQAGGTEWRDFRHNDLADLEAKLAAQPRARAKIIATDGVYSMGSPNPPLAEYSRLAKKYNATVYVDDAHGFGIIGAAPDQEMPYGHGGNGIVRHQGLDYEPDRIVYVAGLSKAFSSYGAFVTCHGDTKLLLQTSGPYVFSGPTSVASLATALAGLSLNRRDGDARRRRLHRLTRRLTDAARALEFDVDNAGDFPIVGVVMGDWDRMVSGCQILWEHDILITPATFPAVPANRNLVRFSITSANTDEEIDQAIAALGAIRAASSSGAEAARPSKVLALSDA
jgi:myxalamid-type polyketide synthase MxaB